MLPASRVFFFTALVALVASGCGDDESGGDSGCPNCERWTQLTADAGQFAAAHPTNPNVIAYSSTRADPALGTGDIWIREETPSGAVYHRVTDDPGDERLPAWSPDGLRLSFARVADGRSDIWVVNVASFTNPTDLRKLTRSDLESDFFPGRSVWRDNATIIFTDGDDIYEIDATAGSSGGLVELVRDPADEILGLGLRFTENQPSFVRDPGTLDDIVAFISDGRGPQGNISVSASAETGEEVNADISVDGKPLKNPAGDTLRTPFEIFGLAPGDYVVGLQVRSGPDRFCDTVLFQPAHVETNQVEQSDFVFTRPRGAIRVLSTLGQSTRIVLETPGVPGETDFGSVVAETTLIDCLFPSETDTSFYKVKIRAAGVVKDSARVLVCGRKVSQVCLSAAQGGCPDSFDVSCLDTLVFGKRSGPVARWGPTAGKAAGSLTPAQEVSDLWVYDITLDEYRRLTNDNPDQKFPAFSPDGQFIAFIEDSNGERTLRIINVETIETVTVPLPGRTGTRICRRAVAHPTWMPSGTEIVVSLSNCNDEVEPNEVTDLWRVDVSDLLPH
jgi:hypothetical protein